MPKTEINIATDKKTGGYKVKKIGIVTQFYQRAFFISHVFGWASAMTGTLLILKRMNDLSKKIEN